MCADPTTKCIQCGHTYNAVKRLVCPKCKWEPRGHPLAYLDKPPVLTKDELIVAWGALQELRKTSALTKPEEALYEKLTSQLKL